MIDIREINNTCTGCGACVIQCPAKCIKLELDNEGFYVPIIEQFKCLHCGICYESCPSISELKVHEPMISKEYSNLHF